MGRSCRKIKIVTHWAPKKGQTLPRQVVLIIILDMKTSWCKVNKGKKHGQPNMISGWSNSIYSTVTNGRKFLTLSKECKNLYHLAMESTLRTSFIRVWGKESEQLTILSMLFFCETGKNYSLT